MYDFCYNIIGILFTYTFEPLKDSKESKIVETCEYKTVIKGNNNEKLSNSTKNEFLWEQRLFIFAGMWRNLQKKFENQNKHVY